MVPGQENRWNLVADIGGTNARFGLQDLACGKLTELTSFAVTDYATFDDALGDYLKGLAGNDRYRRLPSAACFAVACPSDGETVHFTNSGWTINRKEIAVHLGLDRIDIINDFAAVGHGITTLTDNDWLQLGGSAAEPCGPIAVIGPGTGLGVCSLIWTGSRYLVVDGEGGHADFAPVDELEIEILRVLRGRFGRVSNERILSGAGITNIYQALCEIEGVEPRITSAAVIGKAATEDSDTLAMRTVEIFFAILGSVAGNQALLIGARGGVYIAGGIVPKLVARITESKFYYRFLDKGRFRDYLKPIPVRLITRDNIGLVGCTKVLHGG